MAETLISLIKLFLGDVIGLETSISGHVYCGKGQDMYSDLYTAKQKCLVDLSCKGVYERKTGDVRTCRFIMLEMEDSILSEEGRLYVKGKLSNLYHFVISYNFFE